jgi:hypothetical protein
MTTSGWITPLPSSTGDQLQAIDRAITQLETAPEVLVHELEYREEHPGGREGPTNGGGFSRDDGASRGRKPCRTRSTRFARSERPLTTSTRG